MCSQPFAVLDIKNECMLHQLSKGLCRTEGRYLDFGRRSRAEQENLAQRDGGVGEGNSVHTTQADLSIAALILRQFSQQHSGAVGKQANHWPGGRDHVGSVRQSAQVYRIFAQKGVLPSGEGSCQRRFAAAGRAYENVCAAIDFYRTAMDVQATLMVGNKWNYTVFVQSGRVFRRSFTRRGASHDASRNINDEVSPVRKTDKKPAPCAMKPGDDFPPWRNPFVIGGVTKS